MRERTLVMGFVAIQRICTDCAARITFMIINNSNGTAVSETNK